MTPPRNISDLKYANNYKITQSDKNSTNSYVKSCKFESVKQQAHSEMIYEKIEV